jgi:polyphosphate:AMP phosphotransferase
MFETAEREISLSKKDYKAEQETLRTQLLEVQRKLRDSDASVIILIGGVEGAGKGELANIFGEWFDPRYLSTHAFGPPTEEEAQRPEYWRYWMALPGRGSIGIMLGHWYSAPVLERVLGKLSESRFDAELSRIKNFERALSDDNTLLVKLWLHVSKKRQKKKFEALEKDPATRGRVTARDWKLAKHYEDFVPVCEHAISRTSTGNAPWVVIDAADSRHRNVAAARQVLTAIQRHLEPGLVREKSTAPPSLDKQPDTILDDVDLKERVHAKHYERTLEALQSKLRRLTLAAQEKGQSMIIVFEGWDAAGKGGAIRRLIRGMDARQYRIIPIAAPTEEERAHHYLWRFWRHIPRRGRVTIYDRSWYGRVLVERVEGYAHEIEWRRAYVEINDFEAQLSESGILVIKFWLHISQEEQLRRFQEREQTPYKAYKITEEDYRNREKAPLYAQAVHEMVSRTSTEHARWHLIPSEDKRVGRLRVLQIVCDALETRLKQTDRS